MHNFATTEVEAFGAKWTFSENDFGADIERQSLASRADAFITAQAGKRLSARRGLETFFSSYPDVASSLISVSGIAADAGLDADYARQLVFDPASWLELGERCRSGRDYAPINVLVAAAESLNPQWKPVTPDSANKDANDNTGAQDAASGQPDGDVPTPPSDPTDIVAALQYAAAVGSDKPPDAGTALAAAMEKMKAGAKKKAG